MNVFAPIERFFTGWRFPVLMITVVAGFVALMAAVLLVPTSQGAAGQFAEAFKTLCFGYDPATGDMEWAYVWMFLVQPFMLVGFVLLVWSQPLREVMAEAPRRVVPYVAGALAVVTVLGFGLTQMTDASAQPADPSVFPAERLRTAHTPAPFTLTDQNGETVSLADLEGKVAVVTAVYATCGYTCPMIMAQAKRAVAKLTPEERADLRVVAVTLDPEHDTSEVLGRMATGQGVEAPLFRLATGEPATVNAVLDSYSFARRRNAETGVIDHTNLFVLIDRQGRIAYRFSLGERQEEWLVQALRVLLREPA